MIPAIVSATVSVHLAVVLCHFAARRSFTRARARGPLRPALGAEELTPFELAMLAGGRQRVGEVALAALFLGGRVVARGDGSVSRPAPEPDPESAPPPLRALAPIARALEARVEPRSAVPADDLVAAAAGGDMCTALLWRLRRLGLHTPPERLRAVRRLRALTCGTLTAAGIAAALAGPALLALGMRPDGGPQGAGPALCAVLLLTYPFHLHLAWRLLGGLLGAAACGAVAAAAAVAAAPVPYAAAATAAVLYACWFAAHTVSAAARGR
ncbi:TIGR04222 domain-containing membrane protein, partial [Nocardiopsis coralliicola]